MITVFVPNQRSIERNYILSVILGEYLGLPYRVEEREERNDDACWVMVREGQSGRLVLPDVLLAMDEDSWLTPGSLPLRPLKKWRCPDDLSPALKPEPILPVLYGNDPQQPDFFKTNDDEIQLGLDVFGSAFFMLTRYEEVFKSERDSRNRFPATASLAYREGFLDRPIIDEYVEVLWAMMTRLWPNLVRRSNPTPGLRVSHDVDAPSRYGLAGFQRMVGFVAADVLKRRIFKSLLIGPRAWSRGPKTLDSDDPFNSFDWIMDESESRGLHSAFYFISGWTEPHRRPNYDVGMPAIRTLLRRIHARGHEIGLHPSANTYQTPALIAEEAIRLRQVCQEEGIDQEGWGGRMHWLRWETPTTLYGWEQAGMTYDSTLGYADLAGFRCGTCREYPAFDPVARRALKLRIRPLVVMEGTVIGHPYMGLGVTDAAYDYFVKLKSACQRVRGCFTLLWHNSKLTTEGERQLYQAVLDA